MEGIYACSDATKVYKAILDATQEIQKWLRYHSGKCHIILVLSFSIYASTMMNTISLGHLSRPLEVDDKETVILLCLTL